MSQHPTEEDVREFHVAFNIPIQRQRPALPMDERRAMRRRILGEEFEEYLKAEQEDDLVEIADALADIVYVAFGTALEYGIPLSRVLEEVHRSNMSKLGPDGRPIHRADGKVIKGPNFREPDVAGILRQGKAEDGG